MDLEEAARQTDTDRPMSGWRVFGVFIVSAVGYGVGYYIAIAILFATFGLNDASEAPWEMATIGLGSVLAGLGGSLASPNRGFGPLWTALGIAASVILIGVWADIGFGLGMGTGILIASGSAVNAYVSREG